MEYGVIAVAAVGVLSGFLLKLRSFLVVVGLMLVASVGFAAFSELPFGQAAILVFGGQFVLQLGYFVGATIAVMSAKSRRPYVL